MVTNQLSSNVSTAFLPASPAGIAFPSALAEFFIRRRDKFVSFYWTAWVEAESRYAPLRCSDKLLAELEVKRWIVSRMDHKGFPWFRATAVLKQASLGYPEEKVWYLAETSTQLGLGYHLEVYHPSATYKGEDGKRFDRMCLTHILDFVGEYTVIALTQVLGNDEFSSHSLCCLIPSSQVLLPCLLERRAEVSARKNPFVHFIF